MSDNGAMGLSTAIRVANGRYVGGEAFGVMANYSVKAPEPGQEGPLVLTIPVPDGFTGTILVLPDVPVAMAVDVGDVHDGYPDPEDERPAILLPDGNGGVRETTIEAFAASLATADSIEFEPEPCDTNPVDVGDVDDGYPEDERPAEPRKGIHCACVHAIGHAPTGSAQAPVNGNGYYVDSKGNHACTT